VSDDPVLEERFLILAPVGRDAALTCSLLARAGMTGVRCADVAELCAEARRGAAALLVVEDVLLRPGAAPLMALLDEQEPWSDLPLLVFVGEDFTSRSQIERLTLFGNITFLDRPVRPFTMTAAARAALRARRRQYDARAEMARHKLAVRQRDQFLAMLGHELRNPLGAILLAVEMIKVGHAAQKHAEIIERQGNHLARLVDDLLDVARVTTGKVVLQQRPLELNALLRDSIDPQKRALGHAQSLSVSFSGAPREVLLEGDPVRLEQVFTNLFTNAVKYTPAGGRVEVSVEEADGEAIVRFKDSGVGISPEMLPRVFDLFAQADRTLDRSQGGLGIGLTLVRNLVELHGGSVSAFSEGLGRGSEFVVRLPRTAASVAAKGKRRDDGGGEGAVYRVLVVEDNADTRELLSTMLEHLGHDVRSARDGIAALDAARVFQPQVLLIDIGLPRIDGYEVARRARELLGRSAILVALTGYGQPEDKRRALDAGFDVHFTKPIDAKKLKRLLCDPTPESERPS
jgi:signal transduction histidine kinase